MSESVVCDEAVLSSVIDELPGKVRKNSVGWVHLCTGILEKPYCYSYPLIVLFTPAVIFLFSKMFVFKTS